MMVKILRNQNILTLKATELSREYLAILAVVAIKGIWGLNKVGEALVNCSGEVELKVGEVSDAVVGVVSGVEVEDCVGVENLNMVASDSGGVGVEEEEEVVDEALELLGEIEVEDGLEEPVDLLKMILFLTILDSDSFNTSSLSSSVRKWMARMRPRCLLLFTLSTSEMVVTRWCLLVRWEARAFVSPCTRVIGLWQRMQGTRETTIFGVYFSLTGGY